MIKTSTYSILLDNSERTIQRWKKENRPIINFFDKYFTDEDLQEFISIGKISKLDNLIIYESLFRTTINDNEDKLINFIYAYGDDFMALLLKKENFESDKKYKLFFDEYYSSNSTFAHYFDFMRKSKFKYLFDDLERFKDEYDDFIFNFFAEFQKQM